jgi:plastocyanin
MKLISITLFTLYFSVGLADLYMHYPKGCNNRLNEQSANRANANRCFDSQNNNRGGYNVGEMGSTQGFQNNQGAYATDRIVFNYEAKEWANNNNAGKKQFEEVFLEQSTQSVTWTAQHGCGNPKNNCNMVLEYTCDTHPQNTANILNNGATVDAGNGGAAARARQSAEFQDDANYRDYNHITGLRVMLKNGANTNTPNDPNNIQNVRATFQNNNNDNEVRHESEEYYAFAKQRDRNKGLFTADQKLQGDDSTKTRQNPGGTRRGLEVPEERDYFPYWRPSIWRPVAIMHNDVEECTTEMAAKSMASEAKTQCVPTRNQMNGGLNNNQLNALVNSDTEAECTQNNGQWKTHQYNMPEGYPQCIKATWSQVNNLGNVQNTDKGGLPQNWDWVLPTIDQFRDSGCYVYQANGAGTAGQEYVRVVTRMRYNMTTMDYAPYTTDSDCNQNNNQQNQSPVQQNPTVDVGVEMQGLRLALNTAQTGRTFQDRSHVMRVMRKPTGEPGTAAMQAAPKILNVNVQGKRGNIVQTFPAVEYDFWPKIAEVNVGDCIAFQWTGSNTHNNGNPAGDGQAGDAGEGRGGSDRSNLVQIIDKNSTYPAPMDKNLVTDFFQNSKVYRTYTGELVNSGQGNTAKDAQVYFASAGYFNTVSNIATDNALQNNQDNVGGNARLQVLLNNTPASMRGMTVCPEVPGEYEFTCTRNNNFSNRDQKLTIKVNPAGTQA